MAGQPLPRQCSGAATCSVLLCWCVAWAQAATSAAHLWSFSGCVTEASTCTCTTPCSSGGQRYVDLAQQNKAVLGCAREQRAHACITAACSRQIANVSTTAIAPRCCHACLSRCGRRTLPGVSCEGHERSTHALKRIRSPTLTGRRKVMPSTSTVHQRGRAAGLKRASRPTHRRGGKQPGMPAP